MTPAPTARYTADLAAYRADLRSWLATEPGLDHWRDRAHQPTPERLADDARLMAVLHERGWSRWGWPEPVGGLGGDERHRAVLYDEISRAGLPVPEPQFLLETLGPVTIHFAPDLAAAHLPGFLAGREWWAQGFSEPEAGSDLAGLSTRARLEGEHYVVSGQKVWTSHATTATRLVCLVRTGTPDSRHRGLTMLMLDLDSPGVTVRPIALASGEVELAEIFLDEVLVPVERRIGPENGGWAVAMHLLQYERAMFAWQSGAVMLRRLAELRAVVVESDELPDGARQRLGRAYLDITALRARSASTVRRLAAGQTVGPEASVDKVLLAAAEQRLHDLARDLLGARFLLDGSAVATQWRADWWYTRSATILGGSAEVQRTILADHVIGLPKERQQ